MIERFRPVTTRSRLLVLLAGGERNSQRLAQMLGVSRTRIYQLRKDMVDETYRNSPRRRGRPPNPGSPHVGQRYFRQSARRRGISVVELRRAIIATIVNDRLIDAVLDDDITTGSATVAPSRCGEPGPAPVSPSGAGLRGFNERSMRA